MLPKLNIPSPLNIAIFLTLITFLLAFAFGNEPNEGNKVVWLFFQWEKGLWSLLAFSMQMLLVLVLGHTLALMPFFSSLINQLVKLPKTESAALVLVAISASVMGLINWGLGLVFGALLVKQMAYRLQNLGIRFNYPLLASAGYLSMLVWHGGLSGSAPLKIAEEGHFLALKIGVIPLTSTIFSISNLLTTFFAIAIVIIGLVFIAKFSKNKKNDWLQSQSHTNEQTSTIMVTPHSNTFLLRLFAIALFASVAFRFICTPNSHALSQIDLNTIIQLLLSACFFTAKNSVHLVQQLSKALEDATGIVLQFPLYGGIMGLFTYTGLLELVSTGFVALSTAQSLPVFTFLSASLVNLFVPSGGGQWAVQGPIVVDAALTLKANVANCIMALAYGDQLTNMVQPFWAIPLLSITGLRPSQLLKYTFVIMLIGGAVFLGSLMLMK